MVTGRRQIHPANFLSISCAPSCPQSYSQSYSTLTPLPVYQQSHPYRLTFSGPGLRRRCGCEPNAYRSIRIKMLDLLVLASNRWPCGPMSAAQPDAAACSYPVISLRRDHRRIRQSAHVLPLPPTGAKRKSSPWACPCCNRSTRPSITYMPVSRIASVRTPPSKPWTA